MLAGGGKQIQYDDKMIRENAWSKKEKKDLYFTFEFRII